MRSLLQRRLAPGLAVALVLVIPGAASLAAKPSSAEGSPCDAISIDQLNALSELQYGDPVGGEAAGGTYCVYPASPTQQGPHEVGLTVNDLFTIDFLKTSYPDGVEVVVGDHPGLVVEDPDYVATIQLFVQIGDELLFAPRQTLLEMSGGTVEQLSQLDAAGQDPETGERVGQYSAFRVAGSDEVRLRPAMLEFLRSASSDVELAVEDIGLGGKDVTAIAAPPDQVIYLYFSGDTAHLFMLSEATAAAVIALLP